MKKIMILSSLLLCATLLEAQKRALPFRAVYPYSTNLDTIIADLNAHVNLYEKHHWPRYVGAHPGLRTLTGVSPDDENLRSKLRLFFLRHGYFANISHNPEKTSWVIKAFHKKDVVRVQEPLIVRLFGGPLVDTVYHLDGMSEGPSAANFTFSKIGNMHGFVVLYVNTFKTLRKSRQRSTLIEEILELNLRERYRDNLYELRDMQEDFGIGIPHPIDGVPQLINLLGAYTNLVIDSSRANIRQYLELSLSYHLAHQYPEAVGNGWKQFGTELGTESYYLVHRDLVKIMLEVDNETDIEWINETIHAKKIRGGVTSKYTNKIVGRIISNWTPEQYSEFLSIIKKRRELLAGYILEPDKKVPSKDGNSKGWLLVIVGLAIVGAVTQAMVQKKFASLSMRNGSKRGR